MTLHNYWRLGLDKNDRKWYRKHWTTNDPKLFEWIAHQRGMSHDPTEDWIREMDGEPHPQEKEWERSDMLRKMMKKLPQDQQAILFHYYYDGWTLQTIADEMGVAVSTVYKKREKALKKMRYLLGGE